MHASKYFSSLLLLLTLAAGCKKDNQTGNNNNGNNNNNNNPTDSNSQRNKLGQSLECDCDPKEFASASVTFTHHVMKPEDIAFVLPLGLMQKGHVTPIDHQYYFPPGIVPSGYPEFPVYSPADGFIVRITRAPLQQVEPHLPPKDGYDLLIQHSCEVYSYLQLLTGITDDVAAAVGTIEPGKTKDVKIPVKVGQQVAKVGGQSLDMTVFDQNTPAKKWIVPAHYTEMGKAFKNDAFAYYTESIRSALAAKTIRTGEPFGGRFDYDEDGKLVGSWFLKGTNGYDGIRSEGYDYWRGHLSFAYFVHNTTAVEVSIGRWNKAGASEQDIKGGWQFAVEGNSPNPKDVSVATGIIKYKLAQSDYIRKDNGQPWGRQQFEGQLDVIATVPEGILLVQMLEDRLIKVEAFPGKTEAEVTGFTSAAQLYER